MFPIGLLEKDAGRLGKFLSRKVNKLAQTSHCPKVNPDFHCNISVQSHIHGKSTKILLFATIIMSLMLFIAAGSLWRPQCNQPAGSNDPAAACCSAFR
jgi:hypothetical protein